MLGKKIQTKLTVEEIAKLVFHNLEYKFQEKLKGPEKPEKTGKRKIFYEKISENIGHSLIRNDTSVPIVEFETFSKILEELEILSILEIEEKAVAGEIAREIFTKWYESFFPKKPYQEFWTMVLSAECLGEKYNMKATEVVAEMFPIH